MKGKLTIKLALLLVLGVGIVLLPLAAESLSGRDIVNKGTLKTLTGTLTEKDGEWFLQTSEGEYNVHLGNYEVIYPRGIDLKENTPAEVMGFVYGKDIAAVTVKNQNRTYKFRDKDGSPLWSGNGQGRNRNITGNGLKRNS